MAEISTRDDFACGIYHSNGKNEMFSFDTSLIYNKEPSFFKVWIPNCDKPRMDRVFSLELHMCILYILYIYIHQIYIYSMYIYSIYIYMIKWKTYAICYNTTCIYILYIYIENVMQIANCRSLNSQRYPSPVAGFNWNLHNW